MCVFFFFCFFGANNISVSYEKQKKKKLKLCMRKSSATDCNAALLVLFGLVKAVWLSVHCTNLKISNSRNGHITASRSCDNKHTKHIKYLLVVSVTRVWIRVTVKRSEGLYFWSQDDIRTKNKEVSSV